MNLRMLDDGVELILPPMDEYDVFEIEHVSWPTMDRWAW